MSKILKLPKLSEHDGVAEVNIGCCWINAEFHPQRPPEREFLAQFCFANDLGGSSL